MSPHTDRPPVNLSAFPCVRQHPEGAEALPRLLERTSSAAGAAEAVEEARRSVARLVSCSEEEVIFTSGGAESNNAGVKGLAAAALSTGAARRIVLSAVEHPSVDHPARSLARLGFELSRVPVDAGGRVDEKRFIQALGRGAAFAALQWANDEIGALQPVESIARCAADLGVPLHVDATAAAGWLTIDWTRISASTLSIASERMGGPAGAGALVVRNGTRWCPLIEGGLDEEGRRAGPLHPALLAAFGLSVAAAADHLQARAACAARRRDHLARACRERVEGVRIHTASERSLPGHLHLRVPGAEGEALLVELSRAGIIAESGSACVEGGGVPSSILRACGFSRAEAASCLLLRVTASHRDEEMRAAADALAAAARRLRELAP